ncbi:M61 family metallopeptidase [Aliterella atlantica]|uniref:Peptidase M61 n=1 Tax=Aliterella atlantica CENA595 TaxID=1618023 RepID=A0A0D8ZQ57_9CYAN|nr:M61 family metallopeptidase [Aliterella atlantica]KJH70482.1 peptidase M61 [Aliterella atlantica CENA595]
MTEATLTSSRRSAGEITPKLNYRVAMPQPENHLFEVELHIQDYSLPLLDLKLPVWTPGSYLVREYAKHLQDFSVSAGEKPLNWRKIAKNHWQIATTEPEITIRYRIFAHELSVRTNHLDATHGYFNGAALFLRILEYDKQPVNVTIIPPHPDWHVTTPLPEVAEQKNTFVAADFDTLVDSPFEIGKQQIYRFAALGKAHELAIWGGKSNIEPEKAIADIEKIIAVEAEMFGGLPYDRYLFLLHLSAQGNGGLEHKYSCSLNYPRFGFRAKDKYDRFMQLVAHEFFHLWNVKRIRPKALEVFDYDNENYTPSLWFSEGTTSYYDLLIPLRAGIYDAKAFLQNLGKEITRYMTTPGRLVQPVSESSLDAWIKLYRPDPNSGNSQISYYLKGEMVSLLLDLLIRERTKNQRSLDDVMLKMWQQFGQEEIGFTPQQLQTVIESVAGIELADFFAQYIDGVEELPFNQYLKPFGLELGGDFEDEPVPHLGIKTSAENGREIVKFVEIGTPAQIAGIDAGDELLAIDGIKVNSGQLSERIKDYKPHDSIQVTVFHQEYLRNYTLTLSSPRPNRYQVKPVKNPTELQQQNFANYLGCEFSTIED